MVKQYKKKPVVVEALQWTGTNYEEMSAFCTDIKSRHGSSIIIDTLEGDMTAYVDAYIIKGLAGEFYPVREDIFKESYGSVE